jgi:putative oxidoreductase
MAQGLLVLRLIFGIVMAAHGAQKLFGWFGGYGLSGTGGFLESIGFRPGRFFAFAAGASELAGGLLIAAGLFGPVGPALVLATMIVAAITVHWKGGLFAQSNGIEVPLLYAAAAIALGLTGPGALSLDALLRINTSLAVNAAILTAAALGGFANLALRKHEVVTA